MRQNPALTYRGALRLLGKTDSRLLNALDRILGGMILASPLSPFAALWGLVDQKNEAMTQVRKLVDGAAKRMHQVKGFERYELITAAHTVIMIAAFFDTYRDAIGSSVYAKLELSEREKAALATGDAPAATASEVINMLILAELPLPSANEGIHDEHRLITYYDGLCSATNKFVRGLDASKHIKPSFDLQDVPLRAEMKYESYFMELAKDVPEFFVWATVVGQRRIRDSTLAAHSELAAALAHDRESLGRLEEILICLTERLGGKPERSRTSLARANRAVLAETVVPGGALEHVADVTFPSVDRIYQSPRFRIATARDAIPASETWWADQPVHDGFDRFFASFLASPESVSTPLLLLGHPGAGKSLLTKVLAARLPTTGYTAIRVPLRRVDADAPVFEQIQQALDITTHHRVPWRDLADEDDTTLVVFLDGLDELLQASTRGRTSYLQEVADFQRIEADQRRPVVLVVTSRTVVTDRIRIAPTTPLVKLDEFTDEQIENWLAVWRGHNQENLAAGRMREVSLEVALSHRGLACQPLLLLMLAVYAADPTSPPLDVDLSNSAFYEQIIDNFIHREVSKRSTDDGMTDMVEEQKWRLGIAGFGMFNRDRQDISDHELGRDIIALTSGAQDNRPAQVGQETIGRFFFVYTAEADAHRGHDAQRAYEFLHATFGEYLVAYYSVKVLLETVKDAKRTRRGGREHDDDLLFALLCHQSLTTRQTIMNFVDELFHRLPEETKANCDQALQALFEQYRNRVGTNMYNAYQPLPVDHVRRLAAYSANLMLLRTLLAPGFQPPAQWDSTVSLWRAGLGAPGWESLCYALDVPDSRVSVRERALPSSGTDIAFHQLRSDDSNMARYQWGMATEGEFHIDVGSPYSVAVAFLVREILSGAGEGTDRLPFSSAVTELLLDSPYLVKDGVQFCNLVCLYLARYGPILTYEETVTWLRLAFQHATPGQDMSLIATTIAVYPRLLGDIPQLIEPRRYGIDALLIFTAATQWEHHDDLTKLHVLRLELEKEYGTSGFATADDDTLLNVLEVFGIRIAIDNAMERELAAQRCEPADVSISDYPDQ